MLPQYKPGIFLFAQPTSQMSHADSVISICLLFASLDISATKKKAALSGLIKLGDSFSGLYLLNDFLRRGHD